MFYPFSKPMGLTFKPVFNRKGSRNKSGKYSIHIRVTINRRSHYIKTDLPKIKKEYWSGKENKWIKESHPNNHEMNGLLHKHLTDLTDYVLRQNRLNKSVSIDLIKEYYKKIDSNNYFNEYIETYIKNARHLDLATIKVYKTFQKHFNEFNSKVPFTSLNEQLINSFKDYLQIDKKLKGAATKKYFDKFKVICNEAVRSGLLEINNNPFILYKPKIKVEKPRRTYLELKEIKKIQNHVFKEHEKHLELHRDHFIFQCYTGLYYSDLKLLRKSNIELIEGNPFIIGERGKNGNIFTIPVYVFPYALNIIKKYSNSKTDILFAQTITDQKYNEALKKIVKLAEVNKNLTNKVGRHTFAQLLVSHGVPRQMVSKMLGHTKESTTQEYYNMSPLNITNIISAVNFNSKIL